MQLHLKRVYEAPAAGDGLRVLVDRLWPRGLSKEAAAVDLWARDVAPSAALRRWFAHDPRKWAEFQRRYGEELANNGEAVEALRQRLRAGDATLLYGARDEEHNQAVVLRDYLRR